MTEQTKQLKGGKFLNRYVIRATLKALTPFHIGDGSMREPAGMVDEKKNKQLKCNAVVTDANGKAYIPGSSLRGALRDWLKQIGEEINKIKNDDKLDAGKREQIIKDPYVELISENLPLQELIFGSQQNEGKLEVWDAYCTTTVKDSPTDEKGQWCFWNEERMTYVAKSVAINPETGTAEEGKLYNYELVPAGTEFAATFSAQNLTDEELEILMIVLNGFNHKPNPIVLGAMTKLDFGKFHIDISEIYCLDDIQKWRDLAIRDTKKRAGYDLLIDPDFDLKINNVAEFDKLKAAELPEAIDSNIHSETWELNLKTPLVVRSGGRFVWKNAAASKTRNYRMEFNWMKTDEKGWHHVSDLYHSVEILWNKEKKCHKINPYYHIPSSSVRGALRGWTIEHLLPNNIWDIDEFMKGLKKDKLNPKTPDLEKLEPLIDLFGYAIENEDKDISRKYTQAGRLTIRVNPFDSNQPIPAVDGSDWKNPTTDDFGPDNTQRHIKPRNPLDRITHAAKEGGLHHNLEFSKGQTLIVTLSIRNVKPFDKKLMAKWRSEIDEGQICLGGLSGIGRGRVKINSWNEIKKEVNNG